MDCVKFGLLIKKRRTMLGLTQAELAEKLSISDKAISKWERGLSLPDISLLSTLGDIFSLSVDELLSGETTQRSSVGINMKNLKFYVCPVCGNIITANSDCGVSCCGSKLEALEALKADESDKLKVEIVENDWYITSDHPMTKDNYISFVAFLTGSEMRIIKQYPEWDLQVRFLRRGHGKLVWYAKADGLKYQLI